ncbi:MAG: Biotin carboxyl carrier protein of acetyl-CoA carboxylase [Candidatus Omnitrophica bacterium ADurb.Bin277]|nr:MAG: Biotin carboxyl carrier protein of acetyl-CoA carboxylase [Candidatus Omnitrophica bacterium ADurb.Bin277]
MNVKEIKELLELMAEHNVSEIEIEKENMKVKLRKVLGGKIIADQVQAVPAVMPAMSMPAPQAAAVSAAVPVAEEGIVIVRSPMVGTFYAAPAPDQPPYVSTGKSVKEGDVLCIVEAMKLMNEIKSETGGTVVEILVRNGQTVEYDQPIMKIKKA